MEGEPPDGARLYRGNCAPCHGRDGRGDGPDADLFPERPRNLHDPAAAPDDAALLAAIRGGHGTMPPLAAMLPQRQERDFLAFVRQLSPGSIRYSRYCAPCHGDDGHPPATLAGGFRRPTVVFDATYFSHVDAQDLQTALWHMLDEKKPRMPHFAPLLDEAQTEAIVDYLRAAPDGRPR